ncbi:MAG: hypothetical protein WC564_01705 [Patescibacteria group bacterium]
MKTIKFILVIFAVFFTANVIAQVVVRARPPHLARAISYSFVNKKNVPIWIGPNSSLKEKSGIVGWTQIMPGAAVALNVFPDSVEGQRKDYAKLAFRLTSDISSPTSAKDYLISFSKVKTTIFIADTKIEGEAFVTNGNKERAIGFYIDQMADNTVACILINRSSVAITFTDPGHPFYGRTLMSQDSIALSSTQRRTLVSTGFKDSKISIIMSEGDNAIRTAKTLPIYENSEVVILTDQFFDLASRNAIDTRVYPLKLRLSSPVDVTVEGAYDRKGRPVTYIIPGGERGEKGKIVYVRYGENYVNLKFFFGVESSQALIIRANERSSKNLVFTRKGTFIETY